MADKKVDATTGEVQEPNFKRPIRQTIHCKPVYNYQSVEFDCDIHIGNEDEDLVAMERLYKAMLGMLVRVSETAPQKDAKPLAPVVEPASEKQKEILRNFHIDFKPDITKKQAHALIKKSMDQEIF